MSIALERNPGSNNMKCIFSLYLWNGRDIVYFRINLNENVHKTVEASPCGHVFSFLVTSLLYFTMHWTQHKKQNIFLTDFMQNFHRLSLFYFKEALFLIERPRKTIITCFYFSFIKHQSFIVALNRSCYEIFHGELDDSWFS